MFELYILDLKAINGELYVHSIGTYIHNCTVHKRVAHLVRRITLVVLWVVGFPGWIVLDISYCWCRAIQIPR